MRRKFETILICLLAALTIVGCVKKRGCTDAYADNYDPEAKQDDDTCEPTRDKFIGTFLSNGTILVQTNPDSLVPYEDVIVSIIDSTLEESDRTGLLLGIKNMDPDYNDLTLDGLVSGTYNFEIVNQDIEGVTYYGDGNINGRVLEMYITRLGAWDTIFGPPDIITRDTLILNIYGLKELEP